MCKYMWPSHPPTYHPRHSAFRESYGRADLTPRLLRCKRGSLRDKLITTYHRKQQRTLKLLMTLNWAIYTPVSHQELEKKNILENNIPGNTEITRRCMRCVCACMVERVIVCVCASRSVCACIYLYAYSFIYIYIYIYIHRNIKICIWMYMWIYIIICLHMSICTIYI